jgi:hypothetical protein
MKFRFLQPPRKKERHELEVYLSEMYKKRQRRLERRRCTWTCLSVQLPTVLVWTPCSPRWRPTNNVRDSPLPLPLPRGSCRRCRVLLVAPPRRRACSYTSLLPPCTRLGLASLMEPCAPSNRCTRAN